MTTSSERTATGMAQLSFDDGVGVATITMSMPGRVNKIDDSFGETLGQALEWALARPGLKGIIIASSHKDFCVGADIEGLYQARDAAALQERLRRLHGLYRSIETCGVPVVAALTGSALGGGYELALACHRRIAVDDARIQVGLPEVNLGVIPGAGGTQRLPRLIGIQAALENIAQGRLVRAPKAVSIGMVDELVPTAGAVRDAALRWIAEHPQAKQPWDDKGAKIPGPRPGSDDARNLLMAAAAMLRKKTAGVFPAPERAISAVQEGLAVTFDRALEIEIRHFVHLAVSDQAKDMIRTIWFHRTAAEKHEGLPHTDAMDIRKVGVLGAGMMGAGIAYASARAGLSVVLRDIEPKALEAGMAHCEAQAKGTRSLDAQARSEILGRIQGTTAVDDLTGCDLIVEAVFEDLALKHRVTREAEPKLSSNGIWASNTSALPITDLASVSNHADRFIGLHFFSPVEKMQLLEIVVGKDTSEATLARSLAYCRAIGKLPIVVNDGYGFYTSRVFSAYVLEGAQLVAEGQNPVLVEWAARRIGMVVPPLQVFDEVTLSLAAHAFAQGRHYGRALDLPGVAMVERMANELGRKGRSVRQGFYDYQADGRRIGLWSGLSEFATMSPTAQPADVSRLGRRILGVQALEAARCIEDGIIRRPRDAEVGAIFGIGFAPNTGGPLSYIDRTGLDTFVEEMDGYCREFGPRYTVPTLLRKMAADGQRFFPAV